MARLGGSFRRFGGAVLATAAAQFVSAAALILLPFVLSGPLADDYAIGIQTGTAGLGGIVIGVVYNIAIGRPHFGAWRKSAALAALASPVLGSLTYLLLVYLHHHGRGDGSAFAVLGIFSTGGAALAYGAVFAVRRACLGKPQALVMSTLAPSSALVVGLVLYRATNGAVGSYLPATLWAMAAAAQAVVLSSRARESRLAETTSRVGSSDRIGRHTTYLAIGAFTATVLPNVYSAALTQLPAGTLAWVFIVGRIGTAVVGLGVNTLLTVAYSWTKRPGTPRTLLRTLAALSLILASVALITRTISLGSVSYVFAAGAWLILLVTSAIALRDMNSRADVTSIGMKTITDLSVSTPLAAYFTINPSISGYFGAFSASQAITLTATAYSIRDRALAAISICCIVTSIALVVAGW